MNNIVNGQIGHNAKGRANESDVGLETEGPPPQRIVVKIPLEKLKAHPRQNEVFPDLKNHALAELSDNIKCNGLTTPIEIAPDRVTIICGHRRVAAVKLLGWTEIDAIVREDLTTEDAVMERLVRDNFDRRQLDTISMARCYQALKESTKNMPYDHQKAYKGDVRDFLAKRFGMSGRNLERYLKVLKTPLEVQQAVSQGKLSVKSAGAVAGLPPEKQKEIARKLRLPELDPENVVANYIPKKAISVRQAAPAKQALCGRAVFLRSVEDAISAIDGRLDEVKCLTLDEANLVNRIAKLAKKILKAATVVVATVKNSN